jgi:hypothetical protein
MAGTKSLSYKEVIRRLRGMGFRSKKDGLFLLGSQPNIRESDLRELQSAVARLGMHTIIPLTIFGGSISGIRQFQKKRDRGQSERSPVFHFIRSFQSPLGKILENRHLSEKGYKIELSHHSDSPFPLALEIYSRKEGGKRQWVCVFNFDLFFNREGKPGVVLGNLQEAGGGITDSFSRRMGKRTLDFLLQSFETAFPSPSQRLALRTNYHSYRRGVNRQNVLRSLIRRGKITIEDAREFREQQTSHKPDSEATRRVRESVKKEVNRIKRDVTGIHLASFKRAGFGTKSKSRYYRIKKRQGKNPQVTHRRVFFPCF